MIGRIALTAVMHDGKYIIGAAEEGTDGYVPMLMFGEFPSWDAAQAAADARNEQQGMSPEEAIGIVLGTMRRGVAGL